MKNIIFDLDGTLWDSTNSVFNAWSYVFSSDSRVTETVTVKQLQSVFGLKHDEIGEILFPYLSKYDQDDLLNRGYDQEIVEIRKRGGELYPKLEEVLINLSAEYDLYIVSNCQSGYVEAFLEFHDLGGYFKDIECSGNTGEPKGYNIKLIIERNNLEDSIYVGDTRGDCNAAKENNIPFVYAEYGFGSVESPEYSIPKLEDIVNVVNQFNTEDL